MKKIIYLIGIILLLSSCNNQDNNSNIQSSKKENISQVKIQKENKITEKETNNKEISKNEKNNIANKKETNNINNIKEESNQLNDKIEKDYNELNKIKADCFGIDYNNELKKLKLLPKEKIENTKNYCDNLNKETFKNIEFYSNKQKNIEKLNLASCKNKDCKLEIIFSKYNKKGCELIKNNENFYNECLKIKKSIDTYKEVKMGEKYYNRYNSYN